MLDFQDSLDQVEQQWLRAEEHLIGKELDGHITVTKEKDQEPRKNSAYATHPSKENKMWSKTSSSNIDSGR